MIANCGALGLDWRSADLSDYLEALEAHNEAQNPDSAKPKEASDELKRFMSAHGAMVKGGG
ncbi:hypothetical protein INR77_08855 [Erythrobacter sp. SCSIO 43205]|uniref:hypothetical protein n=1 Tax=Erythrobacter sp. SCSIO 43205 TaxID=2779361 RepID=UPI001CA80910|nr:hypothetical protein [Erythrobacter sp. SCSIO 43205]UAB76956.1 hypothetical protein INR77_08855 [Erythrobacter sp. SCSIO 43205]